MNSSSSATTADSWCTGEREQITLGANTIGDLWVWLQFMWLQLEVVRGPVGVDRFGAGLGRKGPQSGPKSATEDPYRTSDSFALQPHEM